MSKQVQNFIDDARRFQRCSDHDLAISSLQLAQQEDHHKEHEIEIQKLFSLSYRKIGNYNMALLHINNAINQNAYHILLEAHLFLPCASDSLRGLASRVYLKCSSPFYIFATNLAVKNCWKLNSVLSEDFCGIGNCFPAALWKCHAVPTSCYAYLDRSTILVESNLDRHLCQFFCHFTAEQHTPCFLYFYIHGGLRSGGGNQNTEFFVCYVFQIQHRIHPFLYFGAEILYSNGAFSGSNAATFSGFAKSTLAAMRRV